jgi:uncharacterized protein YcbK (DUF882 family)
MSGRLSRRAVLGGLLVASGAARASTPRLALRRAPTGETLYVSDGTLPDAGALCRFLRDPDTGQTGRMDLRLVELVILLGRALDLCGAGSGELIVTDAYRSAPAEDRREDALSAELHAEGRALDLYVPDLSTLDLRAATDGLPGGVGLMLASGRVHLDTGAWRRWSRALR